MAEKTPQGNSLNVAKSSAGSTTVAYSDVIKQAASHYGVDETLIKAIIQVESGYNPDVVSRSNAVGLMQIKASTAGRDAYRMKGRNGQPSSRELKDPVKNIDIGAAYINILQNQQLAGINDPQTLRYATIVSYANGAGAMLRTFHQINVWQSIINSLSPNEFYQHIQRSTRLHRLHVTCGRWIPLTGRCQSNAKTLTDVAYGWCSIG